MKLRAVAAAWFLGFRLMLMFGLVGVFGWVCLHRLGDLPEVWWRPGICLFIFLVCPFLCLLGYRIVFPHSVNAPPPARPGFTACAGCHGEMPPDVDTCPHCGYSFTAYAAPNFLLPPTTAPLPACHIRPMQPADFPACEAIYRLNEPNRFPQGYFEHFCVALRGGHSLFLVLEVAGVIRGFGGLARHQVQQTDVVSLNYGMIHPDFHRQRFGAVLLLARLTALPQPTSRCVFSMYTAGGSETYYRRYGFECFQRVKDETGAEFDGYWLWFSAVHWRTCRTALEQAPITFSPEALHIPASRNDDAPKLVKVT